MKSMICNLEPRENAQKGFLWTADRLHFPVSLFANLWGRDGGHRPCFMGKGVNQNI